MAEPEPPQIPEGRVRGGEMGQRIRDFDWSSTPLGPIEQWPQSLKTSVSLILSAQMPMWLGWGPEMRFFYNDAYIDVLSHAKHPWALGRPAEEVWSEIWHVCGPLADKVFRYGEAPFVEDVRLFMDRGGGFLEEVYYSFSYSPIEDESGHIGGLFCPNTEVTARLLNTRRLKTLSELSAKALVEKTRVAACASAAATLVRNPDDVPFALFYLADETGVRAHLEQAVGVAPEASALSRWPVEQVLASGESVVVDVASDTGLPRGLADQRIAHAIVLPIIASGQERPLGALVAGINPTRRLDTDYRTFFDLLAGQVATALQSAIASEEERRRADMLAELDRAKTAFFSNVSHEFRTPLTLMLGPTEDALATPERALRGASLETVYRNELRLLKLVNALLDFSRIEAGRMQASYEAIDLAAYTADLASGFRSAIERAGLTFEVEAHPLGRPVAVDREMWEKIVLNLLSNALKFTLRGQIRVTLRAVGPDIELAVADSGTGIPPEELPRLFERFHRVENPDARTHEGSGIGLALVQELAKLHGGGVTVESVVGQGTTFRVRIPMRSEVPGERAQPQRTRPTSLAAYVEEAQRWAVTEPADVSAAPEGADHVLLADDNADMRDYLRRLLEEHWRVTAVADGQQALEHARRDPPDLVLSDVMMPGLDGFELLAALRADEATASTPVILLSARAGDEARVEGLGAGADDYLVKPFSARELVARVRTHLALARARRQTQEHLEEVYGLLMQVPALVTVRRGPEARCVFQNTASLANLDQRGKTLRDIWQDSAPEWLAAYERVLQTGATIVQREIQATRAWQGLTDAETRYWDTTWSPIRLPDGTIDAVMTISFDVTDRVRARAVAEAAEQSQRLAQQRLRAALDASDIGTYFWDVRTNHVEHDDGVHRLFGFPPGQGDPLDDYTARIHEDDRARWRAALATSARDGTDFLQEYRVVKPDGSVLWLLDKALMVHDPDGAPSYMIGAGVDITEQKRLSEAALAASRAKDEFLAMLGHELRNPLAPIVTALDLMKLRGVEGTKEQRTIERQVQHLTRLVDDLLDISRVTRGLIELKCEHLDLRGVIAKAVEISAPAIDQKKHHLAIDVPDGLIVNADPTRLAQVFANLLTNAARYTPTGGQIAIAATGDAEHIRVDVRDSGIGIPADMLTRVFELFEQGGNRGAARSEGGLGIGLALVRNFVRLHGGHVAAMSDGPGRGSTFRVELPAPAAATATATVPARSAAPDHLRRILLVDDNADAAELLSEMLRGIGHDVVVAHDGPRALAVAGEFHPDVAILDIGLPVMDGYELGRQLRQGSFPNGLMIALTGYGQAQDRARSHQAGFDEHLVKPVDFARLARVLSTDAK